MKLTVKIYEKRNRKPRNHIVVHVGKRKAGKHEESNRKLEREMKKWL